MKLELSILALAVVVSGCDRVQLSTMAPAVVPSSYLEDSAPPPLTTSLFPADQAVLSDDVVARILSSKLQFPDQARVALMRFPDNSWGAREYGRFYWRDEAYLKLQQSQIDTLAGALMKSGEAAEVNPLPTLMIPRQISLSTLRESAVRMQADLLLVFRIGSDTYSQYRTFSKDQAKAYSTCELVLLDVRTGLVPFTRVISREQLEEKQTSDLDLGETMRRAEEKSAVTALDAAAGALVDFLKNAPKQNK